MPQTATPPNASTSAHVVVTSAAYVGGLRCRARHQDSGVELGTAAPVDNNGDGSSFSPTDLVGTALGTCILTTMAIAAKRDGVSIDGATVRVEKEMTPQPPRRIARLGVRVEVPASVTDEQLVKLKRAAEACPVSRSLHPDTRIELDVARAD